MTKVIGFLMAVAVSSAANAGPEVLLTCVVPAPESNYMIFVSKDLESVPNKEVLGLAIVDSKAKTQTVYLTVGEVGSADKELAAGGLNFFGAGVNFVQDGGVLKDVGTMNVSYNELNEVYEGAALAGGTLYPVICIKTASMSQN